MSGAEDEAALNWMAITGNADMEAAKRWLEVAAGDLQAAVALYMDSGGGGAGAGAAAASSSASGSPGKRGGGGYGGGEEGLDEDRVRKADATKRQRLIDHQPAHHPQHHLATMGFVSPNGGGAMAMAHPAMAGAVPGAQGAGGVNPFRDFGAETRGAFGRGGSPWEAPGAGIGALFAPPMALLFKGPFVEARAEAKRRKRWLLVNVQSDSVFASHILNRDVFKDELVSSVIADGFVFWQAQYTVPEARSFLDRYHQSAAELPLLAVLDPRTQRLMWSHTGALAAGELASKLTELCSSYSLDDESAMPLPPPHYQPPRPVQAYDRNEDEQLAMALAASMRDEEARQKRTQKKKGAGAGAAEVVDVDGSSGWEDDDNSDSSEVEVVGVCSPAKGKGAGADASAAASAAAAGGGKKREASVYSVDDDDDEDHDGTATATMATARSSNKSNSSSPPAAAGPPAYLSAPLEAEPPANAPGSTRIQVRLPDGKRLQRVFPLSAPVAALYRFAHERLVEQGQGQGQGGSSPGAFDLTTTFPAASLKGPMERGETLEAAKLANSSLSLMWTEG